MIRQLCLSVALTSVLVCSGSAFPARAGDVTVWIEDRTLHVQGSNGADEIRLVQEREPDRWVFTPYDGTPINGALDWITVFPGQIDAIEIRTLAGHDVVVIEGHGTAFDQTTRIDVDLGTGDNFLFMGPSTSVIGTRSSLHLTDDLTIRSGLNDVIFLDRTVVDGSLVVDSGPGDDKLMFHGVDVVGSATFLTGPGNDSLELGSLLGRLRLSRFDTDLQIDTGAGDDSVNFYQSAVILGDLDVGLGSGDDSLIFHERIGELGFFDVLGAMTLDGGVGKLDSLSIEIERLRISGLDAATIIDFEIIETID